MLILEWVLDDGRGGGCGGEGTGQEEDVHHTLPHLLQLDNPDDVFVFVALASKLPSPKTEAESKRSSRSRRTDANQRTYERLHVRGHHI